MYSNCLFEAVKAKVRDPKSIRIHYIPAKFNIGYFFPHFWWEDGENAYDFKATGKTKFQVILFKGKPRKVRLDAYKIFIARSIEAYTKKICLRLEADFRSINNEWYEDEIPENVKNIYIMFEKDEELCIRAIKREDANKYDFSRWRIADNELADFTFNGIEKNEDELKLENTSLNKENL